VEEEKRGGDTVTDKTFVHILDSTLRDGSHALSHQLTAAQVSSVARGLDDAGVEMIEVSHGDGLGGSTVTYGFSKQSEMELLQAAAEVIKKSKLAILLLPGIGTKDELKMAADCGAKVAQIATHVTEADIAEQHIGLAKNMGMEVIGMLMLSHMASPEKIAEQGRLMEGFGTDVVLVTDSAGALMPETVRQRIGALRGALRIGVGFHGHNNLSLAVANSVAAIEEGARWIDACTCGLGAGSGNTPTEVLAAVLDKMGYETGINLWKIMDVAENIVRPIMPKPVRIGKVSLTMGYAGVYSSFLLHADKAAAQFGVDARDILVELGRRKVVGGQEDMIVEVAMMLAEKQKQSPKISGNDCVGN
jgi:4-hydroxy-2-oxovalerate aldolase